MADDAIVEKSSTVTSPSWIDGVEKVPGSKKPDPILVVDGVQRRFGGLVAVDVQHVEIQRGVITALIGPNGAGKTTFFNLLTGFDKPNEGSWSFNGKPISGVSPYKVARRGMVRTFQLTKVLSRLTVLENMRLGATKQRGEGLFAAFFKPLWKQQEDEITEQARDLLTRFKLDAKPRTWPEASVVGSASCSRWPGPDGQARDGDARRADGRGQPGSHPVPARTRERPSHAGHDGAVRRARHGHGPGHRRLGHRDGAGTVVAEGRRTR